MTKRADRNVSDLDADAAFAQRLLHSAGADALPESATEEAWARFTRTSAGVASIAGARPDASPVLPRPRGTSVKWLSLGAVCGSALTAALMGAFASGVPADVATLTDGGALAPAASAMLTPGRAPESELEPRSAPAGAASGTHFAPPQPRRQRGTRAANEPGLQRSPVAGERATPETAAELNRAARPSSLAAEVAALDAVQGAIRAGSFQRAVGLIEQYRLEFPRGQLTRDADALAIDAFHAAGDEHALAREVERFLSRHASDPHAARIRALLKRAPASGYRED